MLQKFRSLLKNEKGLTLIELLAVVVILGIIAAIAVPSIGKLIENSREDAHIANAQQLMSAARLAILNDEALGEKTSITLSDLEDYIEKIDTEDYASTTAVTVVDGKVTGANLITKDTPAKEYKVDEKGDIIENTSGDNNDGGAE